MGDNAFAQEEFTLHEGLVGMIGTDHTLAPVDARSALTVDPQQREAKLGEIRDALGATGIALLNTCNRTELWATFDGTESPERRVTADGKVAPDDPFLLALASACEFDPEEFAKYFVCRTDDDAVDHLFNVSCGLRSAIMAEDQIITQVKDAIAASRDYDLSDGCLEVLFRHAVTSAKHVKSSVQFTRAYSTAIDQAIEIIKDAGVDLSKSTCMVIGNGKYGRLAASTLVKHGAHVLVTVRQYSHGYVEVPEGCEGIPYAQRYDYIGRCDIVMSATTSPHYTLEREQFAACAEADTLLFDLAIPRDIDPAIAELGCCEVYDIDSFGVAIGAENAEAVAQAQAIIDGGVRDFRSWVNRRAAASSKPNEEAFFPLFVNLHDKHIVFIGAGTIALRRLRTILPFAGTIDIVAPDATPEIQLMAETGAVNLSLEPYDPRYLEGADIVLACTNDPDLNAQIAQLCHEQGRIVNVSSNRKLCDFYFPGVVKQDNVVVGVSAAGKNHRRVRQIRKRITRLLQEEDI